MPSFFHGLDWEAFQAVAPNPTMPTYGEILRDALDPHELTLLGDRLAMEMEARRSWTRQATCFLAARRA